jgi:hypothetical protein
LVSGTGLPLHALIWYALGRAQLATGNLEEARPSFERILARQEHLH